MFGIGFFELICLAVVALIVLGPEKLPLAARNAGMWYGKFRRTLASMQNDIEQELNLAEARKQMQEELAKIKQAEQEMQANMKRMENDLKAMQSQTAVSANEFIDKEQQSLNEITSNDKNPVAANTPPNDGKDMTNKSDLDNQSENITNQEPDLSLMPDYVQQPLFVRMTAKQRQIHLPSAPLLPRLHK